MGLLRLQGVRSVILSPFFVALPVSLLIILLLPELFPKYNIRPERSGQVDKPDGIEFYEDLDDDGTSERIILFNNTENKASIKILSLDGDILFHYYFSGVILPTMGSLVTGRFHHSRHPGIFFLTRTTDSILLQGICPADSADTVVFNLPVTWFHPENSIRDLTLPGFFLQDMDGDGVKEIISGIMAGFRVEPRMLFMYNTVTKKLIHTPRMGACATIKEFSDLDGDHLPEILLHTYAIDNNSGKVSIPVDDHSAWLLVFNSILEPIFEPVQFKGKYQALTCFTIGPGGARKIICLKSGKTRNAGHPELLSFNIKGQLLKRKPVPGHVQGLVYSIVKHDSLDPLFLFASDGRVMAIDTGLNISVSRSISAGYTSGPLKFDLDGDHEDEMIFPGSYSIPGFIARKDFSNPVPIPGNTGLANKQYQVIRHSDKPSELFIQAGERFYTYSYHANLLYWLKYPFYLAIYLVIVLFVHLIGYMQRQTMKQRYQAEQKIAGMQLLLLKNQWDPHFTYNAISVISALIVNGNAKEANQKLMALAGLMRSGVLQSNGLSRSLSEELQFVEQYVKLVGDHRPDQSIELLLEISPDLDLAMQVPRMITQIYVENAIKHGLRPKGNQGKLTIRAMEVANRVFVEIEDNGIGRKEASKRGGHGTGKGMAIADQTIGIFNRYNAQKIEWDIEDLLTPEGNARGTLVRLSIPVGMKYDICKG
jgi:anti-sigma regulatory factor (Ser/Thr protein kinase)